MTALAPSPVPERGPHDAASAPEVPATPPSRSDATVRRASGMIGGPWGRHAGVWLWSWWTPTRVLLAMTCFTLLLAFAQKSPCATGNWESASNPVSDRQYTHVCYSDVVPLWSDERLADGAVPYRDTAVEYPVLTGGLMWLTAGITRGVHAVVHSWSDIVIFGVATAALLAICGLITTAATAGTHRRRPYDAAIFALSPLLIFHAYTNWDLLAMGLTACAIWAWAREKPVLAGVFIGLGTAAKLYPAFLLVALLILALRTRRWSGMLWCTLGAGLSWLAVNGPVALAYHRGWWEFYQFSIDRPTERSTIWAMARTLYASNVGAFDAPYWVPPGWGVALALIIALAAVAWIGLAAPVRPRFAQLAFLVVLAFLITTKVWSPQYSLWLVPLLALARPRWRLALIWQFTEIAVWIMTLQLLHGLNELGETSIAQDLHGITYGWLMLVLLARDAILLSIAALIVRDMWQPELDVVRAGGVDDPSGGEFDGAPDHGLRLPRGREYRVIT